MKWSLIYDNLIDYAKNQSRSRNDSIYYESHHIVPKHMGGPNDSSNLVLLTFREHVLAHYLLWRIHNKYGDKIMYMFRSNQTEEAQQLRVKMAVESNRNGGKGFTNWVGEKNPMKDPGKVKLMIDTKRKKYDGKLMSEDARIIWHNNLSNRMKEMSKDPEVQAKRSRTIKEINAKLTPEELKIKYNNAGENNANFGWTKGYYEIIDPSGIITKYDSQADAMQGLCVGQKTLLRWRNKGVIVSHPTARTPTKWEGWEFRYFKLPHPNTGKILKDYKKSITEDDLF